MAAQKKPVRTARKLAPKRRRSTAYPVSDAHTIASQVLTQLKGPTALVAGKGGIATQVPDGTPWVGPIGEINSPDHGLVERREGRRRKKVVAPKRHLRKQSRSRD